MIVPDRSTVEAAGAFTFMDPMIGTATTLPMYEEDVRRLKRRKRPLGFAPSKRKKRAK